ncbi:MerC domain-containing protein [uncultured Polaribacter sp.]|uniref:MerC domain-containing protein n=1 Tax=uncultured Polaribacter sp. TaxID=174711 RepID=UPI0026196108|nr:MerC domain-containing protein [uncultured Polaribacter sp.]
MILLKKQSDLLGTYASSLCLVHCIATPLLFIGQTKIFKYPDNFSSLWKSLDYLFLTISFLAVYWTAKSTDLQKIKPLLWMSWLGLFTVIINEKLELMPIPEFVIYFPTLVLVFLHLYNRKHCKCKTDKCCINE